MELKMPMSTLTPTIAKMHLTGFSNKILNLESYAVMFCSSVPPRPAEFLFGSMSLFLGLLYSVYILVWVSMYILSLVLLCPSVSHTSPVPFVSHN